MDFSVGRRNDFESRLWTRLPWSRGLRSWAFMWSSFWITFH
jgi:hypothetical protein